MVADRHALRHKAGVSGPYLLAAHSYGGLIVRYHAQKYPRETAGMVLLDAFGTNIKRLFGRLWPRYAHLLNFHSRRWSAIGAGRRSMPPARSVVLDRARHGSTGAAVRLPS